MNLEQVEQVVQSVFRARPDTLERMTFGHCNVVYGFSVNEQEFIIRTNEDPAVLKGTSRNLNLLSSMGLPVPRILSMDLSMEKYPSAYMILHKIKGRDLRYELPGMTKRQMTEVAEQVTSFELKAGQLPFGTGYGWVPIGGKGPYKSWLDVITRDIDRHIHHLQPVFSAGDIQTIYQALDGYRPYLLQVKPHCFLDDITIKNVIVHEGVLQGIIDFDWVCYGDPLYQISLTQTGIISDIGGADALFYIEELCRIRGVDEWQRRLIDFYSWVHSLQFLGFLQKERQTEPTARIIDFMKKCIQTVKGGGS